MKTINGLTKDNLDALKFVLENTNPNDQRAIITIKDLRQIDKICALLDKSGDSVELEDADFGYLKNKFESFNNWNPVVTSRKVIIDTADKLDLGKDG